MAPTESRSLGRASLAELGRRGVAVPGYDLDHAAIGHAHIGPGVFHRGHQAVFADRALALGHPNAAICAISMRSASLRDALAEQDNLYTCVERQGNTATATVIGSIREILVAAQDPQAAVERLADPAITVVTTTVTEAGYCFDGESRTLDRSLPSVRHDQQNPDQPMTMPGLIASALARRRQRRVPPFAIVPCDNIVANGQLARAVIVEMATATDPRLGDWVADTVAFCSTMVDRMVPTTTDDDRAMSTRLTGLVDAWPVVVEPFSQWVIERQPGVDLSGWEAAGAEVVDDVERYEQLKLRVLNGAHSAIAYAGLTRGLATVSQAFAHPQVAAFVGGLLDDEIVPTVVAPRGVDLASYIATTIERFADPALGYTTRKVAGDGSLKLAQRLMPVAGDRLAAGLDISGIATVFALWMWCLVGPSATELGVADPQATRLREMVGDGFDNHEIVVDRILLDAAVFGALDPRGELVSAVRRRASAVWRDRGVSDSR
ncbi:MAG: mannitol dehydrogenase family protein [Ilumatobacteraceae bacterium]